jgi:hypothetical protein
MKTNNKKEKINIGDNVWVYLNKSKIHSGCYNSWFAGKVVGFTNKRIKCETSLGYDANGEEFLTANYLHKNVKLKTN